MVADWLAQVGHDSRLVSASGLWQPIGYSKWIMVADWLEDSCWND